MNVPIYYAIVVIINCVQWLSRLNDTSLWTLNIHRASLVFYRPGLDWLSVVNRLGIRNVDWLVGNSDAVWSIGHSLRARDINWISLRSGVVGLS